MYTYACPTYVRLENHLPTLGRVWLEESHTPRLDMDIISIPRKMLEVFAKCFSFSTAETNCEQGDVMKM